MGTKDDVQVIQMMRRFGGSFARALAEACVCADDANLAKIRAAFPELWREYAELRQQRAERSA